jgi:hypothetical protein
MGHVTMMELAACQKQAKRRDVWLLEGQAASKSKAELLLAEELGSCWQMM